VQKFSVAIAVIAVAMLSGCIMGPITYTSDPTETQDPTATQEPTTAPAPSQGPTSSPSADPSDPGFVPETVASEECHPWVFTSADVPEQVQRWALQIPVDSGPQEYAMGTTNLNSEGAPAIYVVASGDNSEFIAERFCINTGYLYAINAVRRGDQSLYVGDTVNLDAHTITSVGDQNGIVTSRPVPDPIPPQR
jgi:LysM repeat protein